MIHFIAENLAPIMFATLILFLLVGYPVAFTLAANGLLFFVIGVELAPYAGGAISLDWPLLQVLPGRILGGVMGNETLLAVPFFTFMGLILERSGMAEDLLDTIGKLFGPVRGGLAYAVVFVGALLAATTGVVAASVISMGLISLPIMLRYGYNRSLATGTIAAAGTLAQIIPPSLVLIVLADQLGRSVGDMYKGALLPGLVLSGMYMGYVALVSLFFPSAAPGTPPEARRFREGARYGAVLQASIAPLLLLVWAMIILFNPGLGLVPFRDAAAMLGGPIEAAVAADGTGTIIAVLVMFVAYALYLVLLSRIDGPTSRAVRQVISTLVPPLLLIFLVLGTIFRGIATPTEGGAMGAVGALTLALANRRLTFPLLKQAMDATARLTCFVMFILIGARVFSLTFYGVNGHIWVEHLLTGLPGGQTGFLVGVMLLVFVLAFFLDFFELAFIVVPLLAPAAEKLGIDLIWFGVLLAVNMQTSFMHPPFGFALFYLRSVAPLGEYVDKLTGRRIAGVKTTQIYYGAIPYVAIQLIMVGILIAFPWLVLHFKQGGQVIDPSEVQIEIPSFDPGPVGIPGLDQPIQIPPIPPPD